MKQNDLNREVAWVTGESISRIKRIGFLLAEPNAEIADPEDEQLGPHVIDWDTPLDHDHVAPELTSVAS